MYNLLVRIHFEYAIQANCRYLKEDIHQLGRIQRAATRLEKGLYFFMENGLFLLIKYTHNLVHTWRRNTWVPNNKLYRLFEIKFPLFCLKN